MLMLLLLLLMTNDENVIQRQSSSDAFRLSPRKREPGHSPNIVDIRPVSCPSIIAQRLASWSSSVLVRDDNQGFRARSSDVVLFHRIIIITQSHLLSPKKISRPHPAFLSRNMEFRRASNWRTTKHDVTYSSSVSTICCSTLNSLSRQACRLGGSPFEVAIADGTVGVDVDIRR